MVFGMIMLVLAAAIALYHYIQGFFSAMISAVLTLLAALIALSYHELVAEKVLGEQLPNQAHAVALVGLFALAYVLFRLATDKLIPGNVFIGVLPDKIGAGVCGAFAGIFATGILAMAAQMLPFGPNIAGYSRFSIDDREVANLRVKDYRQLQNLFAYGEMKDRLVADGGSKLFPIPMDSITLGLANLVSNGGSLAGSAAIGSAHPAYLDELFGQRLGAGTDTQRIMYGVISIGEPRDASAACKRPENFDKITRKEIPAAAEGLSLVVRTNFGQVKGTLALTPGAVRLVMRKNEVGAVAREYFPVGVFQGGRMLATQSDDPLFVSPGKSVDFVFAVDSNDLLVGDDGAKSLPAGSFIEVKRAARGLVPEKILPGAPTDTNNVGVEEKTPAPA